MDVGHIFSDDADPANQDQLRADALVMDDWMVKGFSQFKLDAINLSYRDLRYGGIAMAKDKFDANVKQSPMLADIISANAIPAKDLNSVAEPKPYLIREVSGRRLGKPNFKVGIIGLTEQGPGGKSGFVVEEPLARVKQILPEVRAKADMVVVLAYMPLGICKEMAKQNPDIDVIIAGNATPQPPPAQREGKTIIAYAAQQTKSLGELRIYLDREGHILDYVNRYILLDTQIPDQPEAAKLAAAAKTDIDAAKAKLAAASGNNGNAQPAGQPAQPAQPTSPAQSTPPTAPVQIVQPPQPAAIPPGSDNNQASKAGQTRY